MIRPLQTSDAQALLELQRASYRIEADLLGVTVFPPLAQTLSDIEEERPAGYVFEEGGLIGAITYEDATITRLVVAPQAFRRGIGRQLVSHLLAHETIRFVSTGEANLPAIGLYESFGFEQAWFTERDGIRILHLEKRN
ncbi:GNAT family N-acetyltransferase [Exiguobacterium flavidum]|uniref:GNAT family N-acetyltransferase n=1 Tax=Exiguobacterium flavidum TaxID=2184695 RepID=UPI000DF795F4|nr:GNAT family N-acetyltransferase [Exiguobacterium flavidum]